MKIDEFQETIHACRFCFMCRHLSAVGNVTFRESDTPRGRALIAGKMQQSMDTLEQDYIDAIFKSEISASCRFHCVSHFDEAGLVIAAREDIVAAGKAPEPVKVVAEQLKNVSFSVEGSGDTLYYVDSYSDKKSAPAGCKTISGGDTGRALQVLGYTADSEAVFAQFANAVKSSGCVKLVTSCPASFYFLKENLNGVEVMHASAFLSSKKGSGEVYYLESDYLKNYCAEFVSPAESLTKLGYSLKPFGTNPEESYTAGEGAVVYDRLYPEVAEKMCKHISELADNPTSDVLVTASPYTKAVLNKYAPELTVKLLDEILVKGL